MNRIYKVIWSKARNCYVVVSELAKRNGKCSSSLNKKIIAAFLAAGMTMAATVSVEASAVGVNSGNGTLVRVGTGSGDNYVAVGDNAVATGSYAVAVGNDATTGRKATQAEAQIGAYNTLQATIKADAAFAGVTAVQNATNYTSLVNALNRVSNNASSSAAAKTAANSYINQLKNQFTTRQNQGPISTSAIAIGNSATAGGTNAIAVGNAATTLKEDGTGSNNAIAVGNSANARSQNTVAIGTNARSVGDSAIAIGQGAMAHTRARVATTDIIGEAPGAIALGSNAWALTPYSVVIGSGNTGQQGIGGRMYLMDTPEQGGYSISIGTRASNFGTAYTNNENAYYANTKYSTAIGYAAHTHAANATAIGTSTDATGERSFAFGTGSTNTDYMHGGSRAGGQGSIVIGDQATTYRYAKREHDGTPKKNDTGADIYVNDSMAMGTGSWAQSRNAVALGGGMSYTWHQYGTDAAGNVDKTKMTNMTKYYHGSGWEDDAEGTGAHVGLEADGGVAIGGATADVEGTDNSYFPTIPAPGLTVKGYTTAATIGDKATRAVAIGSGAAIGDNAVNSVAVGARNIVSGVNSTAVGSGDNTSANKVSAYASGSFGNKNLVGKQQVDANGNLLPDSTTKYVFAVGGENEIANASGNATSIGVFGSTNKILGAGLSTNSTIIGNSNEVANKLANSLVAGNSNINLNQVTNSQIIGNSNTEIGTNVSELVVLGNSTKAKDYITSAIAIGQDTEIKASNTIAVGSSAKARGTSSVAIGNAAQTADSKEKALAIGASANAGEKNAIAIGASAKASKENTLAVGANQEVAAKNAGAFGVGSYISGESSYSVGNSNNVYAKNALAMGNNITIGAGADNSIALGEQSVIDSNIKYGVALGAGSTASRKEGDTGYDYSTNKTSSATSTAWQATHAAVSVGDDGNMTRQITGVAAGSKDTDAVNVAQLKQVQWNIGIDVESVGDPDNPDNPDNPAKGTVPADHKLDVATTVVGPGTNKVKLIAGEGMTLSGGRIAVDKPNDGYGIIFSTDFQKLETNHANEVSSITYKGIRTTIANSTSPAVAKVATDHRALNVENVLIREEVGGVMYDFNYRTVTSPYLNINGIADPTDPYKDTFIAKEFWSNASGTNAIAMGREADATAENALAVGHMAESTNPNTTSLGYKAHALANNAVALGTAAFSTGNRSIAVGTSSVLDETKTTSENYQRTWAAGQGSIALGNEARAVTEDERFSGKTEIDYETNDAIAIGTRADARAMNAIALGGNMSYSDADGNVTYGKQEGNDRDFGATVGEGAVAAISIGGAYGKQTTTQTADGVETTSLNVEYEAAATYGARGIAIGTGAAVANTEDFLDLKLMIDDKSEGGYQDLRDKYYKARAKYTATERALREYETAHPGVEDTEHGRLKSEFDAANVALFGTDTEPGAQQKFDAKIQEKIKLEKDNAESVKDAIAIGTNANAETAGAVALGSNSVAGYKDRAGTESKITGYDERTGTGYNGRNSTSPTWRSTAASVSVGGGTTTYENYLGETVTTTVTRRISNVAAGVYDTDAVNVAQLKRAATINADNRNVALAMNDAGEMTLNSPYIHVNGVEEASKDYAIYGYGSAGNYRKALEAKKAALEPKLGYVNDQRKTVTGSFDLEIAELDEDIKSLKKKEEKAAKAGNQTMKDGYAALLKEAEEARADIVKRKGDAENALKEVNDLLKDPEGDFKKAEETVAKQSQAYGEDSVAIGKGSVVGKKGSTAEGKQSVAIGSGNTVTGTNSIAVGTGHKIYGKNSGAFGDPTEIDATVDGSYAIGNSSHITTSDSFVLGNNVTTAMKDSVYLGSKAAYNTDIGASTAGVSDYSNVKINGNAYTFAGGKAAGIITVGDKGTERRIQNVAAGLISQDSTDAINGSQLYAAMQALSIEVIGDTSDTKSTIVEPKASDSSGTSSSETDTGEEINIPPAITYEVKASTTKVNGSTNIDVVDINEVDPLDAAHNYDYKISLKEKLDLGENGSVTIGNTTLNSSGVTVVNADGSAGPKITQEGIDAAGKKITNVERGSDPNDAVNFSQLQEYAAGNNQAIANVDSRARKGIAGAAALAALHPMDFDPDDKLTFAAGMGHYRGENAAALGLFYRPDEKVMFSLGGTVGNGENMVNAGVSFSLDRTPRVTGSRTALAKEVVHLREQVARQDAQIAKQDQQIAMQGAQIAQLTALVSQLTGVPVAVPSVPQVAAPTPFPDNLDNKWAYDVIEDLEQRGYFTGYAGRELTRDEFAAALDRAMAGGAKLEERIIREFEPELSHVRVAHVEGKGNYDGEWYERPRASHDKYENKHEIAKKYSRVQEKKVTSKS